VPVVLSRDINRGAYRPRFVGTQVVMEPEDAAMIRLLVNSFAAMSACSDEGLPRIERPPRGPVFGTLLVRHAHLLPAEDAVDLSRAIGGRFHIV